MSEFRAWPKTPRLFRDIIITEKIDGTNAAIIIEEGDARDSQEGWCGGAVVDGIFYKVGAQSRKRIITPDSDNFGFARWVADYAGELASLLVPGYHYGEWWGSGIQRGYGLKNGDKRFSLFNVDRYIEAANNSDGLFDVVPVLYRGPYSEAAIRAEVTCLRAFGSVAAEDYDNPEGIVVFHSASRQVYKVLLENDELPKGQVA